MVTLFLALEDRLGAGSEAEPAISVGAQRIAGDQRSRDRRDQRELVGRGDAEHRQPVVAEAADLLVVVAGEHLGQMADTEAHLGAERRRQQFARHFGRVDRRRRIEAIVAIAAAAPADPRRNARSRIARRQAGVSTSAASAFSRSRSPARRSGLDLLLDPLPGAGEILRRPEQPRFGRLAVAPRASGLLVISLDALGDRGVGDDPHVGLVDAHPKRDRGGDHHLLGIDECRLVAGAHLRLEPGVIGQRRTGRRALSGSAIFSALSRLGA